ncbi:uncharacterized protein BO87DRAFT_387747 [Aspergillus neoniger CBS 115656]|uniref:Uncharacterized protein n=1 Tax=Aspergillus neoniger (strain CBS 115656) TaxID=1448310 RepID=A0A318YKS1_ASPNB|nr:hypothetical protein BO87DRAFT_387747 [Aspergillus neoniger CBS 115656]PYH32990.1 hypothetical protein BO87DRAFT_387747 [Aspergillus neoniger CBS 115656]
MKLFSILPTALLVAAVAAIPLSDNSDQTAKLSCPDYRSEFCYGECASAAASGFLGAYGQFKPESCCQQNCGCTLSQSPIPPTQQQRKHNKGIILPLFFTGFISTALLITAVAASPLPQTGQDRKCPFAPDEKKALEGASLCGAILGNDARCHTTLLVKKDCVGSSTLDCHYLYAATSPAYVLAWVLSLLD